MKATPPIDVEGQTHCSELFTIIIIIIIKEVLNYEKVY